MVIQSGFLVRLFHVVNRAGNPCENQVRPSRADERFAIDLSRLVV
jgi:hypothetical protein